MSHNNDNSGMLYFGGMVVIVVILGLLIKILKSIMMELSLLFTAIGKMAQRSEGKRKKWEPSSVKLQQTKVGQERFEQLDQNQKNKAV